MKTNRLPLFLALTLLALALSACGGTPAAATWPGLAASQDAAYLANGSIVYAVRLSDGEQLWSFPEKPSAKLSYYANPVLTEDGHLLLGSSGSDHHFFVLDAATGKEIWSFLGAGDHWVSSPLVVGQIVYAPNADGNLYVFDLSIPGEDKLIETVSLGGKSWSTPVLAGDRLIVPTLDHNIRFFDVKTLKEQNSHVLGGAIAGNGTLGDDRFYIGSFDSAMVAMNASDGGPVWITPVQSWIWSAPLLVDGTLYFGDLGGNFYVINAADGSIKDTIPVGDGVLASPILAGGKIIFVTEGGTVYSLEPGTDKPFSLEKLDSKIYTTPVLAGDLILVAPFQSKTALLIALDKDGKQVWTFTPQK
jgi:outer membrane protein assembly factor BamB